MACQPDQCDWGWPLIINADTSGPFGMSNILSFSTCRANFIAENPYDLGSWGNPSENMVIDSDFSPSYATRNCALSMSYEGDTVKKEDTSFEEGLLPEAYCEMWPPKYNLRSDDQSNTSTHTVRMSELETRFSGMSSTSPGREPANAPATGDLQLPVYSRRCSSDTITSTSSESSTLPNGQQPSLSDKSNPATARKRKNARHNTIEKRYREKMNKNFLKLEDAISGSGASNQSVSYPQNSMCGDGGKKQWQKQSKSKILSNVLAYIHELQEDNARLRFELSDLKRFINT